MAAWIGYLLLVQGLLFVVTGVWPLLSMRSFEAVTGEKTDDWLVKTVGVLVTVIGAGLLVAWRRGAIAPETALIAAGSSVGLAAVDLVYVYKRVIRPVYLLDAVLEGAFVVGWTVAWLTRALG